MPIEILVAKGSKGVLKWKRDRDLNYVPMFHNRPECYQRYEPYNCECPDTGMNHHDGKGGACSELDLMFMDPSELYEGAPGFAGLLWIALNSTPCAADSCGMPLVGEE